MEPTDNRPSIPSLLADTNNTSDNVNDQAVQAPIPKAIPSLQAAPEQATPTPVKASAPVPVPKWRHLLLFVLAVCLGLILLLVVARAFLDNDQSGAQQPDSQSVQHHHTSVAEPAPFDHNKTTEDASTSAAESSASVQPVQPLILPSTNAKPPRPQAAPAPTRLTPAPSVEDDAAEEDMEENAAESTRSGRFYDTPPPSIFSQSNADTSTLPVPQRPATRTPPATVTHTAPAAPAPAAKPVEPAPPAAPEVSSNPLIRRIQACPPLNTLEGIRCLQRICAYHQGEVPQCPAPTKE